MVLKVSLFGRRLCNKVEEMGEDAAAIEAALNGLSAEYDEREAAADTETGADAGEPAAPEPPPEPEEAGEAADTNEDSADSEEQPVPGDDTSAESDAGSDAEDGSESAEPDLASVASDYGLAPEMAEQFSSVEEMKRWVAFHDQLARAERQTAEPAPRPQPAAPPPEREPEAKPTQQPSETPAEFSAYLDKLREEGYGDELLKPLELSFQRAEKLEQDLKSLLAQREAEVATQRERETQQQQERFIDYLDRLGEDGLFGSQEKFTAEHQANLNRVYQEVQSKLQAGVPLTPGLVERAARAEFFKHFEHKAKVGHTKQVQKQSKQRMGTSRTEKSLDSVPWEGDVEDDPVIKQKIREFQEANGEI